MTGCSKRHIVGMFVAGVAALVLYGLVVEPEMVTVRHVKIRDHVFYKAYGALRIVHISDIHLTRLGERERRIIKTINGLRPDIVCVTGDLCQWGCSSSDVVSFLKSLRGKYGVFVVLGDSDMSSGRQRCFYCHYTDNIHRLREKPRFLRDQCVAVGIGDSREMTLCGISPSTGNDQYAMKKFYSGIVQAGLLRKGPVLILSHFSRYWSMLPGDERILFLSGNTHGGQVWTPRWLWPYLFPGKDYRHLMGVFRSGNGKWLYVNPGLGTTRGFPIRIGVPPEITLIEVAPE